MYVIRRFVLCSNFDLLLQTKDRYYQITFFFLKCLEGGFLPTVAKICQVRLIMVNFQRKFLTKTFWNTFSVKCNSTAYAIQILHEPYLMFILRTCCLIRADGILATVHNFVTKQVAESELPYVFSRINLPEDFTN